MIRSTNVYLVWIRAAVRFLFLLFFLSLTSLIFSLRFLLSHFTFGVLLLFACHFYQIKIGKKEPLSKVARITFTQNEICIISTGIITGGNFTWTKCARCERQQLQNLQEGENSTNWEPQNQSFKRYGALTRCQRIKYTITTRLWEAATKWNTNCEKR